MQNAWEIEGFKITCDDWKNQYSKAVFECEKCGYSVLMVWKDWMKLKRCKVCEKKIRETERKEAKRLEHLEIIELALQEHGGSTLGQRELQEMGLGEVTGEKDERVTLRCANGHVFTRAVAGIRTNTHLHNTNLWCPKCPEVGREARAKNSKRWEEIGRKKKFRTARFKYFAISKGMLVRSDVWNGRDAQYVFECPICRKLQIKTGSFIMRNRKTTLCSTKCLQEVYRKDLVSSFYNAYISLGGK